MLQVGNNILIVLHGSIGDVTRALPLVNRLRDAYPNAKITWSIEPPSFPLVENHPAVDEVIVFDRPRWRRSLISFLRRVRAGRFDFVVDLQRILKSGVISRWTGAPHRLGFHRLDSKEGNWLFNNLHIEVTGQGLSKLSHYLKFAEYLGVPTRPIEWKIRWSSEEDEIVSRRLRSVGDRFAVFYLGARWESKRWFPHDAALCAREVHDRYGLSIVVLGGEGDLSLAREMENYGMVPLANFVGVNTLRESVVMLARARVAVGPDTGLMHLSAAVGTPVVSLWGATDPVRTGAWGSEGLVIRGKADCSPCYRKTCAIGRICMQSIPVEAVVTKVGEALTGGC